MSSEDTSDNPSELLGPHGGYKTLRTYQNAEIVHDATVVYCDLCIDPRSRTRDQMVQAARSGEQNIAEGSKLPAHPRSPNSNSST